MTERKQFEELKKALKESNPAFHDLVAPDLEMSRIYKDPFMLASYIYRLAKEREQYNNGGVIARDLAQTLRRTTRFDQTDAGRYLIALRSAIGSSDWNAVIDLARRNLPPVQCD